VAATKPKKPFYKSWIFWLIVVVVTIAFNSGDKTGAPTTVKAAAQPSAPLPEPQLQFVRTVSDAQSKARSAENDMQRGGIKAARDKQMCSQLQTRSAKDWIGKVERVGANSDGKGVFSVEIAKDVEVKTWNNALSDAFHKTMLEPGTPLFDTAASLKKGQMIKFSGTFFSASDGDCLVESSLSLSGKVKNPEFIFRFTAIEAL
jgi:hypothetical protein